MNWSRTYNHLCPKPECIVVYYSDGYTILSKEFQEKVPAVIFKTMLLENPDFHFVEMRRRTEVTFP